MRHVPLAYQCFLDLAERTPEDVAARRFSLAQLPSGEFSVQRKPSEDDRARNLLSVFLTPGAEAPDDPIPVDTETARAARHDGFIRHGEDLIVVIEAKRYDQPDCEQARSPGRMVIEHPGNVRFVSWTELVDQWLGLTEKRLLSHAESELLDDFLELLADNEQINPFSKLSRCLGRDEPIALRLKNLLGSALDRSAEPRWEYWESGGEINGLSGSAARLLLTKYSTDSWIRLGLWAGLTQHQKNVFYGDSSRLETLAAAAAAAGPETSHWTVQVESMLEVKPPRFDQPTDRLSESDSDLRVRLLSIRRLAHKLNMNIPTSGLANHLEDFVEAGLTSREPSIVRCASAHIPGTQSGSWSRRLTSTVLGI
jgi:hypothetical protein